MDEKQPSANHINSINRAFDILRLFRDSWELGIQDISRLTGLNKTTVFRVVKSLEANRMLEQNLQTAKYHPGFAIVELAHSVYKNFDVKHIFLPYMRLLREGRTAAAPCECLQCTGVQRHPPARKRDIRV